MQIESTKTIAIVPNDVVFACEHFKALYMMHSLFKSRWIFVFVPFEKQFSTK